MENVWSYISHEVYANNKQYRTVGALKRAIIAAWKTIDIPYLTSLYDTMSKHITQVLQRNRRICNYCKTISDDLPLFKSLNCYFSKTVYIYVTAKNQYFAKNILIR